MEVHLPYADATATFKERLQAGDRFDAQRGFRIEIQPDGTRIVDGTNTSLITRRLLRRMMLSWTIPGLPSLAECATEEIAWQVLDKIDDDDYDAMATAMEPWVRKVMASGRAQYRHAGTGALVEPATQADEDKLEASGEFAREGDDPKTSSRPTGITSPAAPALTASPAAGQEKDGKDQTAQSPST